jgi:hypothetical protein
LTNREPFGNIRFEKLRVEGGMESFEEEFITDHYRKEDSYEKVFDILDDYYLIHNFLFFPPSG